MKLWTVLLGILLVGCQSNYSDNSHRKPQGAAIVSAHGLATQAGVQALQRGGNAFDAAVAVAASLGVVEPFGSGIGGGGFWLMYSVDDDRYIFLDAREKAPLSARADQFLGGDGKRDKRLAINSGLSVGVPGQVKAFEYIVGRYGRLTLEQVLEGSIEQARQGFAVDERYQRKLRYRIDHMKSQRASQHFLVDGDMPPEGAMIVQDDLANTLEAIAQRGAKAFHEGEIANQLVQSVNKHGGEWTLQDLAEYQVVEREPLIGRFSGAQIITAPPPSAGGLTIIQMAGMLEAHDWQRHDQLTQDHLSIEAMKLAYAQRSTHVGDPDFVDVPVDRLLSGSTIEELAGQISLQSATLSDQVSVEIGAGRGDTTHLAVIDQYGNRVAATLSINLSFGSGLVAEGTGVLLNNEMDDFSSGVGVANAYGLIGSLPNSVEPSKRPVSSMTPTFVEWEDRIVLLGTPGGSRIPTMVFLAMLEAVKSSDITDWVSRPRFHHQYYPDVVQHESGAFDAQEMNALKAKGHSLKSVGYQYGDLHAISWEIGAGVKAAADPRGVGRVWVGTHQ